MFVGQTRQLHLWTNYRKSMLTEKKIMVDYSGQSSLGNKLILGCGAALCSCVCM